MKFGSYIQLTDKLNEEYRKSFDFIEHYGNIHMVSFEKMAEKMMDLIDLMLEAQEKGQSPEEITGKNLEDFCKTRTRHGVGRILQYADEEGVVKLWHNKNEMRLIISFVSL